MKDEPAAHKRYRFMRINGTAPPYTCIVFPVFIPVVKRRVFVDNSGQVHRNLNPARLPECNADLAPHLAPAATTMLGEADAQTTIEKAF